MNKGLKIFLLAFSVLLVLGVTLIFLKTILDPPRQMSGVDPFEKNIRETLRVREWTAKALQELGFTVLPSSANFVFAKPPAPRRAADVFAGLRKRGIFERYFPGPLTGERVRITIGTDAEMAALLAALDAGRAR